MTNRERYAKEILDIVCEGCAFALKNGVLCKCSKISCDECDLCDKDAHRCRIAELNANSILRAYGRKEE